MRVATGKCDGGSERSRCEAVALPDTQARPPRRCSCTSIAPRWREAASNRATVARNALTCPTFVPCSDHRSHGRRRADPWKIRAVAPPVVASRSSFRLRLLYPSQFRPAGVEDLCSHAMTMPPPARTLSKPGRSLGCALAHGRPCRLRRRLADTRPIRVAASAEPPMLHGATCGPSRTASPFPGRILGKNPAAACGTACGRGEVRIPRIRPGRLPRGHGQRRATRVGRTGPVRLPARGRVGGTGIDLGRPG